MAAKLLLALPAVLLCSSVWAQTSWDNSRWDLGIWDQETPEYTVSATSNTGGNISPSGATSVIEGQRSIFSLDNDDGYRLRGVEGTCGGTLSGDSFTTDKIFFDCTVTAVFEPIPLYSVTVVAGDNGSTTPLGEALVLEGSSLSVGLSPDDGYRVADVGGTCGGSRDADTFVTNPVFQSCSVTVSFEQVPLIYHTVTVLAQDGGTILPASTLEVAESETAIFELLPDENYEVKSATGPCVGAQTNRSLTTTAIFEPCQIEVLFGLISGTVPPESPLVSLAEISPTSATFNLEPRFVGSDPVDRFDLACEIDDAALANKSIAASSLVGDIIEPLAVSSGGGKARFTYGAYDFQPNPVVTKTPVGKAISFPSMNGMLTEIEITASTETQFGNRVIQGQDEEKYFHVLVSPEGKMFGHYFDGESAFEIRPRGNIHRIAVGSEGAILEAHDPPGGNAPLSDAKKTSVIKSGENQGSIRDEFSVVSTLILVDEQIAMEQASMAVADYYITVANTALLNSGVNVALTIAGVETYTPNVESFSTALRDIRCGKSECSASDPPNPQVEAFREKHQADLVVQMLHKGIEQFCGIGYVPASLNPAYLKNRISFSVSAVGSANLSRLCSSDVVAHEIGHNMGLLHDIAQYEDVPEPLIEGGRGYLLPNDPYNRGSIMAYGTSFYRFSTPDIVTTSGVPIGTDAPPYPANAVDALNAVKANYAAIYNDVNDELIPNTPTWREIRQRGRSIEIFFDAVSSPIGTPVTGTTSGLRIVGYTASCGGEMAISTTSPVRVTGLETDQAYDCTLVAFTPYAVSAPTPNRSFYLQPLQISIDASSSGNGTISPSGRVSATERSKVSFTLTPFEDYEIAGVSGTCGGVRNGNTYTTSTLREDCTVRAHFKALPRFIVAPTSSIGGSISPSEKQSVVQNKFIDFTLQPDDGYFLESVRGSCIGTRDGNTYRVGPVSTDCTVIANYELIPVVRYPIAITVIGNGSVSPSSLGDIKEGTQFELRLTPDQGWRIGDVSNSCGGNTEGNIHRSDPVYSSCQVEVKFEPIEWTVSLTHGPNGSISPMGDLLIRDGDRVSVNITPDHGYQIESVENSCGGGRVGFELTAGPIYNNCTISVLFEPLPPVTYEISSSVVGDGYLSPELPIRVKEGDSFSFRVVALVDNRLIRIEGCQGRLDGDAYRIDAVNANCQIEAVFQQYRWKTSGLELSPKFTELPEATPFICRASAYNVAGKSESDYVFKFATETALSNDRDSDGTPDAEDNCPDFANAQQLDFDNDGSGDSCDADDDNDGTPDESDSFPFDADEQTDTDGDGIGNNADQDDDNDGVSDDLELNAGTNPLDPSSYPSETSGLPIWLYYIATQRGEIPKSTP
jgi:hypothetical protein